MKSRQQYATLYLISYMLSFRNAKTVDLYVNRGSQKIGLLYVKSGFYAWIFLTINMNNIHCISKKDYILVINTNLYYH